MECPENLMYTKDHEWISASSGLALVGVTSFAVEQLGDIVHVDLPEVGEEFHKGEPFGSIESTKTVSDLYMPGDGKIVEVNKLVVNSPEEIQESPYDKGWLIKIELRDPVDGLMESAGYEDFVTQD